MNIYNYHRLANIDAILLRAESDGAGVEIMNFQMDSARNANSGQGLAAFVEKCSCPRGYSGLSCQVFYFYFLSTMS